MTALLSRTDDIGVLISGLIITNNHLNLVSACQKYERAILMILDCFASLRWPLGVITQRTNEQQIKLQKSKRHFQIMLNDCRAD